MGQKEPEALKPYLFALKDEEAMLRGAVVEQLAEAAINGLTKHVLRSAVKDSEEGHQLIDLLKDMSENDFAIFSLNLASILKCLASGDIEINGNSDNAVKFNGLDIVIQDLVVKINAELTAIKTALLAYVQTPIVVDSTPAKIDKIKVGG